MSVVELPKDDKGKRLHPRYCAIFKIDEQPQQKEADKPAATVSFAKFRKELEQDRWKAARTAGDDPAVGVEIRWDDPSLREKKASWKAAPRPQARGGFSERGRGGSDWRGGGGFNERGRGGFNEWGRGGFNERGRGGSDWR